MFLEWSWNDSRVYREQRCESGGRQTRIPGKRKKRRLVESGLVFSTKITSKQNRLGSLNRHEAVLHTIYLFLFLSTWKTCMRLTRTFCFWSNWLHQPWNNKPQSKWRSESECFIDQSFRFVMQQKSSTGWVSGSPSALRYHCRSEKHKGISSPEAEPVFVLCMKSRSYGTNWQECSSKWRADLKIRYVCSRIFSRTWSNTKVEPKPSSFLLLFSVFLEFKFFIMVLITNNHHFFIFNSLSPSNFMIDNCSYVFNLKYYCNFDVLSHIHPSDLGD